MIQPIVRPWLLGALVLVSCAPDSSPARDTIVQDSAGVAIVEHSGLERVPPWGIAPTPVIDLGVVDGPPEYQFFGVRGGIRLSDGRIAILNSGSQELRIFDPEGTFLGSHGGPGDGPGEYRAPQRLFSTPGDTLVVWDGQLRRVSFVGPDGVFARSVSLEGDALLLDLVGVFSDRFLLVADHDLTGGAPGEFGQLMSSYLRYDPDGQVLENLGRYPWMVMRTQSSSPGSLEAVQMAFDAPTDVAVTSEHVWIGTAKEYNVEWRRQDGRLRRLVRWSGDDRLVTERHTSDLLRERLETVVDVETRQSIEADFERLVFAERFPAYRNLVATPDGGVWVGDYRRPGDSGLLRWLVFDRDGQLTRAIFLDPDVAILWVGADEVGLLERDDLDVEHVRVHELIPR